MWKWIPVLVMLVLTANGETVKEAPRFSVMDLDGEPLILDSLITRGPVYVSFWALWCKSCIRELDQLRSVYEEYKDKGFELVAVSEDGPRSTHKVKPVVRGRKWKYRVVLDPDKELSRAFQVISLPTSFLIDRNGMIVSARQGFKPGTEKLVEEELRQLFVESEKSEDEEEHRETEEEENRDR